MLKSKLNILKNRLFLTLFSLLVLMGSGCSNKEKIMDQPTIIPKPAEMKLEAGFFEISEDTQFLVSDEFQKEIANTLIRKFKKVAGWNLRISETKLQSNCIQFVFDENLDKEAYNLVVNKEKVVIKASGNAGFIYGMETIRQLLPVEIERSELISDVDWLIPNLEINDKPRFQWRGLMLDISRHYFGKEYIKTIIDGLAMHKMNVLHLHLVDDQGWRIEIKKYPKLTEVGAFRVDQEDAAWNAREKVDPNEKGTYGGYLSQEELKELVAYAQLKNVEIIPEIEMPAHVSCAIASYPYLSCFEKPIGVPSGGVWPITDIYCAGKESTFEFLENVLLEVMEIFPSKYIHIGGDEATKTNWVKCSHCKERMTKEGLHGVKELQSYFVKRIEKFINSKGKKLIGWDEILEGGLAPDATVMSWRGVKGGVEAAKHGHDVIMTPNSHCYFDHYQGTQGVEPKAWGGYTPLSKVYQFEPVAASMSVEEGKHVLGGQANLWSEFIPTEAQSQYMIFPRLAALAEVVWSPRELRDWNDFSARIPSVLSRYEYLGINYAKSAYLVTSTNQINMDKKIVEVLLNNEFPNPDIRYNLDGSELNSKSEKYIEPIQLTKTTRIKASLFENEKPVGKEFNKTIKFHKAVGKKVVYTEMYSDRYKGAGDFGMVNALRGTKNFHDGQWQGWLGKDMEVIIDLEKNIDGSEVTVGAMENQGSGIYFPTTITVFTSGDGINYKEIGKVKRAFSKNPLPELKDFVIDTGEFNARFVKVIATNLKTIHGGGGIWLFIDEIIID